MGSFDFRNLIPTSAVLAIQEINTPIDKRNEMNCPVCKDVNLSITDRQGIEIDFCPKCRGVWLDRGELDKIIERSDSQPSRDYDRDDRPPRDSYHYKRKKSFLSELFD